MPTAKSHRPQYKPLPPFHHFLRRMVHDTAIASTLVAFALLVGTIGYHVFVHIPYVDGLLNSAMIFTGMGEIDPLTTPDAKLFATCYTLFAGFLYVVTASLIIIPIARRAMHRLHLDIQASHTSD